VQRRHNSTSLYVGACVLAIAYCGKLKDFNAFGKCSNEINIVIYDITSKCDVVIVCV
jgi:hypothetical protein